MEEEKIKELVLEAIAAEEDLFLVELKIKGHVGNQKVLVFVDGDEGLSIDQCSKISRHVGHEMEERDIMPGKYTLEVSSPGLEFPITMQRQYVKNVGRDLIISLATEIEIEGTLKSVSEAKIEIDEKGSIREIPFEEIKESKVKISFK